MDYKIITKNNYRYIVIPELTEMGLIHCFTTRDMDIGQNTNKDVASINNYYQEIYDFLEVYPKERYFGYQIHSANIEKISDISQGSVYDTGKVFFDTDGLVTDLENIALISKFADCTPIILFDPVKRVQANIHSGWKGTLQRIGANGINKMLEEYESNPKDIIAVLGPNIGRDDFEVESDVMNLFKEEFDFHKDIIRQKNDIKFLIDIQTTNKNILFSSGIKEENLTIIDLSTFANEDLFHSYRRDKDNFGIMGAITVLK